MISLRRSLKFDLRSISFWRAYHFELNANSVASQLRSGAAMTRCFPF